MLTKIAGLFIFNIGAMFIMMFALDMKINISKSYPLGVYQRVDVGIDKGVLVESCLPENVSKLMVGRNYIPSTGSCGGYPPVIKTVYGLEGDVVEVGERVSVNGLMIVNTELNKYDSNLNVLVAAKTTIIKKGHVWLMSSHYHTSYDARYFGQIPIDHIRSAIKPLWIIQ